MQTYLKSCCEVEFQEVLQIIHWKTESTAGPAFPDRLPFSSVTCDCTGSSRSNSLPTLQMQKLKMQELRRGHKALTVSRLKNLIH